MSQVVLKEASFSQQRRARGWQADDLLFISNYGEGDARQISFAHFSQAGQKNDMPTLKVLGWDNLRHPAPSRPCGECTLERLAWPDDEEDGESWRETWRSAFTLRHREIITTSKDLAVRLAELARAIRDRSRMSCHPRRKTVL